MVDSIPARYGWVFVLVSAALLGGL